MILKLKCQLLEVIADSFENKEGEAVEFYKAQIWQQGEGVASVSIAKELLEEVTDGEHTFLCDFRNGKVRITGIE